MKRLWFLLVAVSAAVTAPSPDTCIDGCKCKEDRTSLLLKIFDCNNSFPILSNETMVKISKTINIISFERVKIGQIDKTTFDGFNDLDTIAFVDSSIGSIDSTAFYLTELGQVSFTNTRFEVVPNLYSDYLEELVFNDCRLSKMPRLDQLPALSLLSLPNNNIKEVDVLAFSQLQNLEELTLTNNSITKLPVTLFDNNPDINTITLDNNPIESFKLNSMQNLEVLSLKSCKLTTFDENSSRNLDQVTQLDLSDNQISILPLDSFAKMGELMHIDLSNNKLVEIDDVIFENNKKLEKIKLDGNNFKKLPKFSSKNKQFLTTYFSCSNCSLKSPLEGVFDNMPAIATLKLANNKIDNVENIFQNIHSLKDLDLSNNNITKIVANAFAYNSVLEILNLKGNPLKPLDPVVFANINGLKKLDVSNAGLAQLWTNHNSILPTLEQLLIAKNNLSVITVDDLNVTPNIKLMDLENNPLNCSKNLHDSVIWLLKKGVYPIQGAKTHEAVMLPDVAIFEEYDRSVTTWKKYTYDACFGSQTFSENDDQIEDDQDDDDDVNDENSNKANKYKTDSSTSKYYDDFYTDYNDDYFTDDDEDEDIKTIKKDDSDIDTNIMLGKSVLTDRNINLARASYILSITSVFVLTALVVLTVAVTITLFVLKRNGAFNHNGNLPRLKIPLWHSTPGQKKHSGSVYRPLSEDLSGLGAPIINRYEFKPTSIVHNSIP